MVVNQKPTGRAVSIPAGLGIGLGISILLTVLMAAISAFAQGRGIVGEGGLGYCLMVTLLISTVLGALTASVKIKRHHIPVCIMSGVCYFLSLLAVNALFFGGQYEGILATGSLVMGGATAAIFLGGKQKRSTSVRIRKIKNR